MKNGYYPIAKREVIRDIYDQYCALGGNGVVAHLMNELEDLPVFEPVPDVGEPQA